jgi:hypothetical protein
MAFFSSLSPTTYFQLAIPDLHNNSLATVAAGKFLFCGLGV